MGTEIDLTVSGITIDWSKNHAGIDHGALFQQGDLKRRKAEQKKFLYFRESDAFGTSNAAFVRLLKDVLPRSDLMGYTIDRAHSEYNLLIKEAMELRKQLDQSRIRFLPFEEYCAFVSSVPLPSLDNSNKDFEKKENARGRLAKFQKTFARIPDEDPQDFFWSERSYFGSKVCVLSAYSMLQVFGLSPANLNSEVVWQFGPLVYAGWAKATSFVPNAKRRGTILVATEGSSDSRILKHGLELLRPDVADFFRFVDVDESHPFWGTGNLVKFAQGLIRIDVQNSVLFVLDNDAEGADALKRLSELGMPCNMRAMTLPDLPAFQSFPARGSQGLSNANINGQAASIEAYLDLRLPKKPPAQVLWSNFKKEVGAWQGAIEHKESYMRHFLSQSSETISNSGYDISKLQSVLTALIKEATLLSSIAN